MLWLDNMESAIVLSTEECCQPDRLWVLRFPEARLPVYRYSPEVDHESSDLPLLAVIAQETRNFNSGAKEPAMLKPRARRAQ